MDVFSPPTPPFFLNNKEKVSITYFDTFSPGGYYYYNINNESMSIQNGDRNEYIVHKTKCIAEHQL